MSSDVSPERALLFYASGPFDYAIMNRMRPGLHEAGFKVVVATHLLSVWLRARRQGLDCFLLRPTRRREDSQLVFEGSYETKLTLISPRQARRFEASLRGCLREICARLPIAGIVQWSGLQLSGRVVTDFARRCGMPCAYLELGNMDAKLFADSEGVGASSFIARNPQRLDAYQVSDEDIACWREDYIRATTAPTVIPQARRPLKINPWFLLDRIGRHLFRVPAPITTSILSRLRDRAAILRRSMPPAIKPSGPFIFLPLQVCADTNLLVFSDYDNLAALRYAEDLARTRGVGLVVKPHPAERNPRHLDEIAAQCAAGGHLWTSYNPTRLMLDAEEVVTINSTVGLAARAFDRPLTVLGRSFYSGFSPRQAAIYAMRYLIDFDPYGYEPASGEAIQRLLSILGVDQPNPRSAQDQSARSVQ